MIQILCFFVSITCTSEKEETHFNLAGKRVKDLIIVAESIQHGADFSLEEISNIHFSFKSPNEKLVARVERIDTGIESQVYMVSISETDNEYEKKIAEVVNFYGLCWSPDSSKIAYSEGTLVHLADIDGKTKQVIYSGPGGPYPGASFNLKWSENGLQLSFMQVENVRDFELANPSLVTITLGVR